MADAPAETVALWGGQLFESIALINLDELSQKDRALIPDWWGDATQGPGRDGVERALAVWESVLPNALPGFYTQLKKQGMGVYLGRSVSEGKPLLVYAATLPSGEVTCWYGFPPISELSHPTMDLTQLPLTVHNFCSQLQGCRRQSAPTGRRYLGHHRPVDAGNCPTLNE
jgi:hypothetical protein